MQGEQNLHAAPVLNDTKWKYFRTTLLSSILGGYKFSNEDENIEINCTFHLIQTILYLLFPLIAFIIPLAIGSNYAAAVIIPAVVNALLNCLIQLYAHNLNSSKNSEQGQIPGLGLGEGQQQFLLIVKGKQGVELFLSIFLMAVCSFLLASTVYYSADQGKMALAVFALITGLTSFYTMVNESSKEMAVYINDNFEVGLYSTAFMRVQYVIIILIIKLTADASSPQIAALSTTMGTIFALLPLIWAFGLLGSPFVTLMYLLEKWNWWVLGCGPACHDVRAIINAIFNTAAFLFAGGIAFKCSDNDPDLPNTVCVLISGLAALILSENFQRHIFLANDQFILKSQNNDKSQDQKATAVWLFYFFGAIIIVVALPLVKLHSNIVSISYTFAIVAIALSLVLKTVQYSQSALILGVLAVCKLDLIKNIHLNALIYRVTQLLCLIAVTLLNGGFFTQVLKHSDKFVKDGTASEVQIYLIAALFIYKAFRHLLTDLQDTFIMLLETIIIMLALGRNSEDACYYALLTPILTVFNQSIANIARRFFIWLYGIQQMVKDKKQQINNTGCFVVLSFTLFLPINIVSLVFSSVLDTPFMPFLGLPLYVIGFPRPKRFWQALGSAVKSSGESLLYKKFFENFVNKLQVGGLLTKYCFLFRPGKFYLLRIEKYLATFQVLEAGSSYIVLQLRGLESQEMTSCHNHEAQTIDNMREEIYDKRESCLFSDFFGAILPLCQFDVQGYEENQIKLTGIVESQEFAEGFKQIYVRTLLYFINCYLNKDDFKMLQACEQNFNSYCDQAAIKNRFPVAWTELINFDCQKRVNNSGLSKNWQDDEFNEVIIQEQHLQQQIQQKQKQCQTGYKLAQDEPLALQDMKKTNSNSNNNVKQKSGSIQGKNQPPPPNNSRAFTIENHMNGLIQELDLDQDDFGMSNNNISKQKTQNEAGQIKKFQVFQQPQQQSFKGPQSENIQALQNSQMQVINNNSNVNKQVAAIIKNNSTGRQQTPSQQTEKLQKMDDFSQDLEEVFSGSHQFKNNSSGMKQSSIQPQPQQIELQGKYQQRQQQQMQNDFTKQFNPGIEEREEEDQYEEKKETIYPLNNNQKTGQNTAAQPIKNSSMMEDLDDLLGDIHPPHIPQNETKELPIKKQSIKPLQNVRQVFNNAAGNHLSGQSGWQESQIQQQQQQQQLEDDEFFSQINQQSNLPNNSGMNNNNLNMHISNLQQQQQQQQQSQVISNNSNRFSSSQHQQQIQNNSNKFDLPILTNESQLSQQQHSPPTAVTIQKANINQSQFQQKKSEEVQKQQPQEIDILDEIDEVFKRPSPGCPPPMFDENNIFGDNQHKPYNNRSNTNNIQKLDDNCGVHQLGGSGYYRPQSGSEEDKTRTSDANAGLASPLDKWGEPFMQAIQKATMLLFTISLNDKAGSESSSQSLDKELLYKGFKDDKQLRQCRAFRSNGAGGGDNDVFNVGGFDGNKRDGNGGVNQFAKLFKIQVRALRYAIKIALDIYSIEGTLEQLQDSAILQEIEENNKNSYIGQGSENGWSSACARNIQNLWNLHYNQHDRTLSVFRSVFKDIKCSLFEFNEDIITGIWANLVWELYYVTNDDDERYSIQTHKNFMRNIIIESAEEPLGYAPFYSGPVAVSL